MYLIKSKLSPATLPLCSREGTYGEKHNDKIVHAEQMAHESSKELEMVDEV
jgi:hypothetical protein